MQRILLVQFMAYWVLSSYSVSAQEKDKPASLDDLQGDWLNQSYADTLLKTLSPLKSWKGIYYTDLRFKKVAEGYDWQIGFNFHEGYIENLKNIKPAGANTYALEFANEKQRMGSTGNNRIMYAKSSPDMLTWTFVDNGTEKRAQFVRVKPTIEEYVNRLLFAGTYTDAAGREFIFTKEGLAKWPDKTFTYKIGLDCVLAHTDYFYLPGETEPGGNVSYAYVREKDKLYVYTVKYLDDVFTEREGKPLYVLTPKR